MQGATGGVVLEGGVGVPHGGQLYDLVDVDHRGGGGSSWGSAAYMDTVLGIPDLLIDEEVHLQGPP